MVERRLGKVEGWDGVFGFCLRGCEEEEESNGWFGLFGSVQLVC